MAEDLIRYDILAQDALRGVVRKVLSEVSRTGLPGEHHFFVAFLTGAPGVRISSRLLAQYPEEMTIVLQHQFRDLVVTDHAFEVSLSFNGAFERLFVPFTAVKGFADPSVGFQLQFVAQTSSVADGYEVIEEDGASDQPAASETESAAEAPAPAEPGVAEVVRLDAFRKK